jgi:hypothetical protein
MELHTRPWYIVDIDISNAIRKDFDFKKIKFLNNGLVHYHHQNESTISEVFETRWLEQMKLLGVEIQNAEMFYREPNALYPWVHVDAPGHNNKYSLALNWCVGPDDGEMVWYNPAGANINCIEDSPGSYAWPMKDMVETHRHVIGAKCTMIQIDRPHSIIMHDLPRYCVSVRTKQKFDHWNQAVDKMKSFIIE